MRTSSIGWQKIKIENGPHFFDFDTQNDRIFLSNNKSNSIQIIDSFGNTIGKISIDRPRKLIYDSEQEKLFVISGFTDYGFLRGTGALLSVIDTKTNKITKQLGEREGFSDMVLHKKSNLIYLAKRNDKKLVVLDCNTLKIIDTIELKKKPDIMDINYNTDKIYFRELYSGMISELDINKKNSLEITHHNWFRSGGIRVDSISNQVYVHQWDGNEGGVSNWIVMIQGEDNQVQYFIQPEFNKFVLMSNTTDFGVFFLKEEKKELVISKGRQHIGSIEKFYASQFIVHPKTCKFYFLRSGIFNNYLFFFDMQLIPGSDLK